MPASLPVALRSLRVLTLGIAVALGVMAIRSSSTNATPNPTGPVEDLADEAVGCSSPSQALSFPAYWAGSTFDGLDVSSVIRRCTLSHPLLPTRANYVSYLYGDCIATDQTGCHVPIEVQTWPARDRNKALYDLPLPPELEELRVTGVDTNVNGVPATKYDEGRRLEIWHPNVTVVISGEDPARIDLFAGSLVEAPRVLTDLSTHNIQFDPQCTNDIHYCSATRVGVWVDQGAGLCLGLPSAAAVTWCPGSMSDASSVEISKDPNQGICLSTDTPYTESSWTWCTTDDDEAGGVWYDPDQGLCLTVATHPPSSFCSGEAVGTVDVWANGEEGVCVRVGASQWCSGPFQT